MRCYRQPPRTKFLNCRLFFANYTSGLLAVNSTLLAYAGNAISWWALLYILLILPGIALIVASGILIAFYYLANVSATSGYGSGYQYYRGFREDSESGKTVVWW